MMLQDNSLITNNYEKTSVNPFAIGICFLPVWSIREGQR
jgi:hypothetical protein